MESLMMVLFLFMSTRMMQIGHQAFFERPIFIAVHFDVEEMTPLDDLWNVYTRVKMFFYDCMRACSMLKANLGRTIRETFSE